MAYGKTTLQFYIPSSILRNVFILSGVFGSCEKRSILTRKRGSTRPSTSDGCGECRSEDFFLRQLLGRYAPLRPFMPGSTTVLLLEEVEDVD